MVVSAPSGAGKTSICREFLKMYPNIKFSVSYTTRPTRPGEVHGEDYYFISEDAFKERIAQGEFAEWVENYGHLYGTSRKTMSAFLDKGTDLILDIEPRGAKMLKQDYPGGIFVFILPPSMDELKTRLSRRGVENEGIMKKRLETAMDEIREIVWYDYVIFNDRLNDAVGCLRAIYVAEKSRRERLMDKIRDFLK
ncbi:MAG: guanylate kinase [Syntrophales bacterium]|nr:guanylate kinase [Syntrophales bacterium]